MIQSQLGQTRLYTGLTHILTLNDHRNDDISHVLSFQHFHELWDLYNLHCIRGSFLHKLDFILQEQDSENFALTFRLVYERPSQNSQMFLEDVETNGHFCKTGCEVWQGFHFSLQTAFILICACMHACTCCFCIVVLTPRPTCDDNGSCIHTRVVLAVYLKLHINQASASAHVMSQAPSMLYLYVKFC